MRLTPAAFPPDFIADFNISSLSGLLSPALTESLLIALPPCHLTGGNATLMVRRANDSKGRLPCTCLCFLVNLSYDTQGLPVLHGTGRSLTLSLTPLSHQWLDQSLWCLHAAGAGS